MIPYDMVTVRMLQANNAEADRFAALEFRGGGRDWAAAEARRARERGPRAAWFASVVAYLSLR
jgi:hypothetical protein